MKDGAAAQKLAKNLKKKGGAAKAGGKPTRDLAKDVVANRGRRCHEKRIATAKAAPSPDGCLRKATGDMPEFSSRAGGYRAASRPESIKRQRDKGAGS